MSAYDFRSAAQDVARMRQEFAISMNRPTSHAVIKGVTNDAPVGTMPPGGGSIPPLSAKRWLDREIQEVIDRG